MSSCQAVNFHRVFADLKQTNQPFTFYHIMAALKDKPRTGWVDFKIENPESIWQHTISVRNLSRHYAARFLGPQYVRHCGELATVHDMAESLVPDFTPIMGIPHEEKRELEVQAIELITSRMVGGNRIRKLWFEYEDKETECARFVKEVDKLQVAVKALDYEKRDICRYNLQEFWDNSYLQLRHLGLRYAWKGLYAQRPSHATDKPLLHRQPLRPEQFETLKSQTRTLCNALA